MIRSLLTLGILTLLLSGITYGQKVRGTVYRGNGDTVLANATVYYSGSMTDGTQTDKEGKFELTLRSANIPIVVSCVGYYSGTAYYKPDTPLIIRLQPKQELLREVTIKNDGMDRETKVAIFKKEFLGTSVYADHCIITNIDDIDLRYSKKKGMLSASCDGPILIVNKKLGYTVSYYLDKFEKDAKLVTIKGNYRFEDNVLPNDKIYGQVSRDRASAYQGSRMQFIRALWHHALDNSLFKIYTPFFDELTQDNIVVQDQLGQRFVHLNSKIYVVNTTDKTQSNPLVQREKYTFIDEDGFYGDGLIWSGMLGVQRMGDLLPFEYRSDLETQYNVTGDPLIEKALKAKNHKEVYADDIMGTKGLSSAEVKKAIFKKMVLTPLNPISDVLVVKKWEHAIKYKIYCNTGHPEYDQTLMQDLRALFSLVSKTSKLFITEAETDTGANLTVLIGKLADLNGKINADAIDHLGKDVDRSGYFVYADNSYQNMVQFVNTDKVIEGVNIVDSKSIWPQLKLQLMGGLGFVGQLGFKNENYISIFNQKFNWMPDIGFGTTDKYLLSTLYSPTIRSGMTEKELDEALSKIDL